MCTVVSNVLISHDPSIDCSLIYSFFDRRPCFNFAMLSRCPNFVWHGGTAHLSELKSVMAYIRKVAEHTKLMVVAIAPPTPTVVSLDPIININPCQLSLTDRLTSEAITTHSSTGTVGTPDNSYPWLPLTEPPSSDLLGYLRFGCCLAALPTKPPGLGGEVPGNPHLDEKMSKASGTPYLEAVVKFVGHGSRLGAASKRFEHGRVDPILHDFLQYLGGSSPLFGKLCRTHCDSQSNSFTTAFVNTLFYKRVKIISVEDAAFVAILKAAAPAACFGHIVECGTEGNGTTTTTTTDRKFMDQVKTDMSEIMLLIAKVQTRTMSKSDADAMTKFFPHTKMLEVLLASATMITALGVDETMWRPFVQASDMLMVLISFI